MTRTAEQQAIRTPRDTASITAGLIGWDNYRSPQQTLDQHTGRTPFQESEDSIGGHNFEEPIIRAALAQIYPQHGPAALEAVEYPCGTIIHPDDWICATPDALLHYDHSGIQAKNHRPHMTKTYLGKPGSAGQWDNELIPKMYLIQVQVEMVVMAAALEWDVVRWYLAAHFGGPRPRVYCIRRDERLQRNILRVVRPIWEQHIDPNGPMRELMEVPWMAAKAPEKRRPARLSDEAILTAPLPQFSPAPASELGPKLEDL